MICSRLNVFVLGNLKAVHRPSLFSNLCSTKVQCNAKYVYQLLKRLHISQIYKFSIVFFNVWLRYVKCLLRTKYLLLQNENDCLAPGLKTQQQIATFDLCLPYLPWLGKHTFELMPCCNNLLSVYHQTRK